jgi:hypothetical protein
MRPRRHRAAAAAAADKSDKAAGLQSCRRHLKPTSCHAELVVVEAAEMAATTASIRRRMKSRTRLAGSAVAVVGKATSTESLHRRTKPRRR